ncbi:pilus assembly protein [Burkholderia ubonensis subsp. mesacidophila]|uniref:Pilus assembly protein n=2 Tax=Burkholderia ubonensis TaxID=101571 RepID=A0A2A4FF01_9BURK|nr:fimbria/pilus periplasmic chaperone [Burkholderia ubonensis]PCE31208.1 pilus assembly protein [Burkholderia ubonensis subsp. mesacidophila]
MAALSAQAAIVITGTRVVYPEQSREVNVRLTNIETAPVLVQSWIDDGDSDANPDQITVPFVLTPPVFRVEPKKGQTLRVMYTGTNLPTDRESLFWLNVQEIPPQPANAEDTNLLQLAFRTRIKLFFRPAALQDGPSGELLKWKVVHDGKGQSVLRVDNPSPYYVSFSRVELKAGDKEIRFDPSMVAPFGHLSFMQQQGTRSTLARGTVSYKLLNDYGAEVAGSATAE